MKFSVGQVIQEGDVVWRVPVVGIEDSVVVDGVEDSVDRVDHF